MPAPADQMFLQLRTTHADELGKRASIGRVMPKEVWQNLCRPILQESTTIPSTR